jgi:hypothetical protein
LDGWWLDGWWLKKLTTEAIGTETPAAASGARLPRCSTGWTPRPVGFLEKAVHEPLRARVDRIGRLLNRLIASLQPPELEPNPEP